MNHSSGLLAASFFVQRIDLRWIMTGEKMSLKEVYRCPICRHLMPVHNLVGEVIVYCRHCKNELRVCFSPVKTNVNKKILKKSNQ